MDTTNRIDWLCYLVSDPVSQFLETGRLYFIQKRLSSENIKLCSCDKRNERRYLIQERLERKIVLSLYLAEANSLTTRSESIISKFYLYFVFIVNHGFFFRVLIGPVRHFSELIKCEDTCLLSYVTTCSAMKKQKS